MTVNHSHQYVSFNIFQPCLANICETWLTEVKRYRNSMNFFAGKIMEPHWKKPDPTARHVAILSAAMTVLGSRWNALKAQQWALGSRGFRSKVGGSTELMLDFERENDDPP